MKNSLLRVACFLLVLLPAFALAADDSIREGKWEFVTEVAMDGMPAMPALPPGVSLPPGMSMSSKGNSMKTTMSQCITKNDLVPAGGQKNAKNCKVTKMDRKGNQVSWSMVCTEDGMKMTGDGVATYTGNQMVSRMTMTSQGKGQNIKQRINTSGRYLGPCGK